jgi:hypothetical protein
MDARQAARGLAISFGFLLAAQEKSDFGSVGAFGDTLPAAHEGDERHALPPGRASGED